MNNNGVLCKFVQIEYYDETVRKVIVNVQVIILCILC
jgi:hypothetical protein